jgi:SAM-dependent methyltransferase
MTEDAARAIEGAYERYYADRAAQRVYAVEFVIRAFLGNYPRLKTDRSLYPGQSVLDLGFGDGRNLPLLADQGMAVSGVEISQDICDRAARVMDGYGIKADLRVGRNNAIPFVDAQFDQVLACHACYYVDPGTTFADNAAEIARVMKPGARFVFSAPMADTYVVRGAEDLGGGHMRVANDPYKLRNGYILKKFDSEDEIRSALAPWFDSFSIGCCRNDFWGIEENVWIVVCHRRAS